MGRYLFSYSDDRESFVISPPFESNRIIVPRGKTLIRDHTHWPIWPGKLFVFGDGDTEICVSGNSYHGNKQTLLQNREGSWFARMHEDERVIWLDRSSVSQAGDSSFSSNMIRVCVKRVQIELFDFQRDLHALFGATLIDDDCIADHLVRLDKPAVRGEELRGGWFDLGEYSSYLYTEQIKEGLERLHKDFTDKRQVCARICSTGIGIHYSTNMRLYKGDISQNEPLLIVHKMNDMTQLDAYANPDRIFEFHGRPRASGEHRVEVPPLAEEDGFSLHCVRGGYLIEDRACAEQYYIIDGLPWIIRAMSSVPETPARDIGHDMHIVDLNDGRSLMSCDGDYRVGRSEGKRSILQSLIAALPDNTAAQKILFMVRQGLMPTDGKELCIEEKMPGTNRPPPIKLKRQEIHRVFQQARCDSS